MAEPERSTQPVEVVQAWGSIAQGLVTDWPTINIFTISSPPPTSIPLYYLYSSSPSHQWGCFLACLFINDWASLEPPLFQHFSVYNHLCGYDFEWLLMMEILVLTVFLPLVTWVNVFACYPATVNLVTVNCFLLLFLLLLSQQDAFLFC